MFIIITFYSGLSFAVDDALDVSVDHSWGLLLGDNVTVEVDLTSLDQTIDKSSMPIEGKRYGTWLYLKTIDLTSSKLMFHYQLVNVPLKNTTIETPIFDVKKADGQWITLPTIAITIGPSLVSELGFENIIAKPDLKPTLISTTDSQKHLKFYALLAIISAIVLGLWHFGWKMKNRQPFAQAVHDLSRFKLHAVSADQAARILHSAFNHTANTVVVYGELDSLFENHQWLQSLQTEITLFYEQSEQHFFARDAQQGPDLNSVRKLAKACRVKEMLA